MIAGIGMIVGLVILLIPFLTNRRQEQKNAQAISSMTSVYDRYGDAEDVLKEQLKQAASYNEWLSGAAAEEGILPYEEQLSYDGDGVMGYLWVPSIDLKILLYHGTQEETLAAGAGHLENTSLPVGGPSSHCVITAHSGMRSMRAFDDIRLLKKGDLFAACIYGQQFVYEVEGTAVVLPEETDSLRIVEGEDRMTLVTCTPYGVNDHRLLVYGVRSKEKITEQKETAAEGEKEISSEPVPLRADIRTIPLLLGILIIVGVVVYLLIDFGKKRRKKKR